MLFFFQAEDGIRDVAVTGVQTCALPISFPRYLLRESHGVHDTAARTITYAAARTATPQDGGPPALTAFWNGRIQATKPLLSHHVPTLRAGRVLWSSVDVGS